jgi:hypothetical protein
MSAVATAQRALKLSIPITPTLAMGPNRNTGFKRHTRYVAKDAGGEVKRAVEGAISNVRAAHDGPMPEPFFTTRVRAELTIFKKKGAQSWDDDNVKNALKQSLWDVLQAKGIVENDRLLRIMPVEWDRDPDGLGYMELVLTEEVPS